MVSFGLKAGDKALIIIWSSAPYPNIFGDKKGPCQYLGAFQKQDTFEGVATWNLLLEALGFYALK